MNVALVTANFPPQRSPGANRLAAMARTFRDRGVGVAVFAARFSDDESLAATDSDLVPLTTWVPTRTARRTGFVVRFIDEWIIARAVLKALKPHEFDFIVVSMPILSFLLLAPLMVSRRKLVIDVRDLTWEYRISQSRIIQLMQRFLAVWSIWSLRSARIIVTATEAEKDYIESHLSLARVIHVANGIEQGTLENLARCLSPAIDPASCPLLMYAGALGTAQGVAIVADAAGRLPGWRFEVIGDGVEAEILCRAKGESNLPNLDLLGPLPRAEVLDKYSEATVLFARLRTGFATAVPSKLYEYLATGKPIVYMGSRSDAAWQLLEQFDGTYRADDDDVDSLVKAIELARANGTPDLASNYRLLLTFTRESQSGKLVDRLQSLHGCAA
jgi:glycosyltransferase involved in cell wall biosynthesis